MKKLIVMLLLVVAAVASAQTKADSTEVNQLTQKIEQLKNQIVTTEAQLYEGEKNLKQLVDQYYIALLTPLRVIISSL